jgi:hypothetical protein
MPKREITPVQALQILIERIDKRKHTLSRMGHDLAYRMAQEELDLVRHQLVKAQEYFVSIYSETTVRNQGQR